MVKGQFLMMKIIRKEVIDRNALPWSLMVCKVRKHKQIALTSTSIEIKYVNKTGQEMSLTV